MAKKQRKATVVDLPINGTAIASQARDKFNALCDFCEANDIPFEDNEYDLENLFKRCIYDQFVIEYGELTDHARQSVLERKGHILVEGIPATNEEDINWGLYDCEPVYSDDADVTHIRLTIQDPDVAMLIKLAV